MSVEYFNIILYVCQSFYIKYCYYVDNKNKNSEKFMNKLRDLREDRDLKQSDVARVLGISQQYYQRYESEKNEIPLRHLITLARFYNVSVDYMIGLSDDPAPLYNEKHSLTKYAAFIKRFEDSEEKIKKAIYTLLEYDK